MQVGVDDRDGIALRLGQTGAHRDLMPEIARQRDHPHARIAGLECAQDVQGGIMASVVDVDELEVQVRDLAEHGGETAMRLANDGFFVETGYDNGQQAAVLGGRGRRAGQWRWSYFFGQFEG